MDGMLQCRDITYQPNLQKPKLPLFPPAIFLGVKKRPGIFSQPEIPWKVETFAKFRKDWNTGDMETSDFSTETTEIWGKNRSSIHNQIHGTILNPKCPEKTDGKSSNKIRESVKQLSYRTKNGNEHLAIPTFPPCIFQQNNILSDNSQGDEKGQLVISQSEVRCYRRLTAVETEHFFFPRKEAKSVGVYRAPWNKDSRH